ncbi:DNA-binding protein [bacterium]|nr:helix-turn-helix domain-containing protein [bacterium]RQW00276.1 MAG: DNA-binding protein [bacterium]
MVILNVQQAAKFLGKTPAALRNGYKRWGVPHFRLGGQIKFTQEALQEWVAQNMTVDASASADKSATSTKDGRRVKRTAHHTKQASPSGNIIA